MKWKNWKKVTLAVLTGSIVFQTPSCLDAVNTIANVVAAGGVLYLVREVLR